jgi:hypothetical protein
MFGRNYPIPLAIVMKFLIRTHQFSTSCGNPAADSFVGAQHAAPELARAFNASAKHAT